MRILIQRVREASVTVGTEIVSEIGAGYLLLVGFSAADDAGILKPMADKVNALRIFEDENGKMNLSIQQTGGQILSVSQFTLYADCRHGNRPSFTEAKNPVDAKELYLQFNRLLQENGLMVKEGIFQADMKVSLINDGPVTVMLDSDIIIKR